jgi:hypothetical protein
MLIKHHKSVVSYSIVLYVEIFEFWQCQEIWSSDTYDQSIILVWIQKTRHAYKSQ